MSISIFNVSNWTPSTNLNKNDIVTNNNLYYYATQNFVSSTNINSDINNGLIIGYIMDQNQSKPYFIWTPSYNLSADFQPKIKEIKFGDGYTQISSDGINNNLFVQNLEFNNRDLNETTAILHFLSMRQGSESFVFITSPPLVNQLRFKCKQWNYKQNFFNNYSIVSKFEQCVR